MQRLTNLQRRILALLEEAGEEGVGTLTNTVAKPHGTSQELQAMTDALSGLLQSRLIEVAMSRDRASLRWIAMPIGNASSVLRDLDNLMEWSIKHGYWKPKMDAPEVVILLTTAAQAAAHQVLSEDGWPVQPLDRYE